MILKEISYLFFRKCMLNTKNPKARIQHNAFPNIIRINEGTLGVIRTWLYMNLSFGIMPPIRKEKKISM